MVPSEALVPLESGPDILLSAARPDVFRVNGFRITGLPVDTTSQTVTRKVDKLRMAGKYGGGADQNGNGPLPLEPPPDADILRAAIQRLRDPEIRLLDEFFWFWPQNSGGSCEDEALIALARGEEDKAVAIWTAQEKQPATGHVAMHNLAVLSHAKALDLELNHQEDSASSVGAASQEWFWTGALQRWKTLLDDEGFWSRVTARIGELQDPRLTAGTAQRMRESLPFALLLINALLAARAAQAGDSKEAQRHVALMKGSGFSEEAVQMALRRVVEPMRQLIKTLCESAEKDADADPAHADGVTRRLLDESTPVLAAFDSLLPPGDATRDGVHDEVALRALTCQIAFGNKTENWPAAVVLLDRIMPIAVSKSTCSRVEDNLKIMRGNIEIAENNKIFGTCFFCGEMPPDASQEASVPMHGDIQSFQVAYNTRRTTWNHNTFKVPRCSNCACAHRTAASARTVGRLLAFVSTVTFFFSAMWWGEYLYGQDLAGWYIFVGAIAAFIAPLFLWRAAARVLLKGRAQEERKYEFTTIREKQRKGWRFGLNPSAGRSVPRYKPDRGKWLGDWLPFRQWVDKRQPIFVSMFALWLPVPLILTLVPVLWGFVSGTPAGTRDLYRIGILSKSSAANRLSDAAADTSQSLPYREKALKDLSAILPTPDPAAQNAIANLRKIVRERDSVFSSLRAPASDLLLKISPDTAVETLTEELASPDLTLSGKAAQKLRELGPAASEAMKNAMNDSNSTVSESAAEILVKIAPEAAIPKLSGDLKSRDSRVRQKAAQLLGQIGPQARDALPMLEKAEKDKESDIEVRKAVASALQAIDPKGHPTRHVPTSTPSYRAGNTGSSYHEPLPEGTYRVPLSDNLALSSDRLSIELERRKANELAGEVNRLGSDLESERNRYNSMTNEVNELARQVNFDRQFLDRTSQFAIDNYNNKVNNYNSSMERRSDQQRRYNDAVEAYNAKLREFKSQQQHVNELVDDYNRKLERVGSR